MSGNTGTQDVPDGPFIPTANMSNAVPMVDDNTLVASEHSAYQGDIQTAGLIGKLQTSAGIVFGAWPYPFTTTTNASGVATIYLTNDGTSTGTAAFTTIVSQSVSPLAIGNTSNYQIASAVISGKTLTVTVNQLGSVVLGLVNVTTAASGVTVQGTVWGK